MIRDAGAAAVLRGAMLDRLDLASDNQIEFLARSIVEWVGPDLIQLDKFEKIFHGNYSAAMAGTASTAGVAAAAAAALFRAFKIMLATVALG